MARRRARVANESVACPYNLAPARPLSRLAKFAGNAPLPEPGGGGGGEPIGRAGWLTARARWPANWAGQFGVAGARACARCRAGIAIIKLAPSRPAHLPAAASLAHSLFGPARPGLARRWQARAAYLIATTKPPAIANRAPVSRHASHICAHPAGQYFRPFRRRAENCEIPAPVICLTGAQFSRNSYQVHIAARPQQGHATGDAERRRRCRRWGA